MVTNLIYELLPSVMSRALAKLSFSVSLFVPVLPSKFMFSPAASASD